MVIVWSYFGIRYKQFAKLNLVSTNERRLYWEQVQGRQNGTPRVTKALGSRRQAEVLKREWNRNFRKRDLGIAMCEGVGYSQGKERRIHKGAGSPSVISTYCAEGIGCEVSKVVPQPTTANPCGCVTNASPPPPSPPSVGVPGAVGALVAAVGEGALKNGDGERLRTLRLVLILSSKGGCCAPPPPPLLR